MIKSETKAVNTDKKYPKLMITDRDIEGKTFIVLFTSTGVGTIVYSKRETDYLVGKHCESWNMCEFEDFNDIITLQNN